MLSHAKHDELEIAKLTAIRAALAPLHSELSLTQLITLITVALEPGLSVNELAERIGVPQQSASRNASILLGRYQTLTNSPQEALITQEVSVSDPRKRALFITYRGRVVIDNILRSLVVLPPAVKDEASDAGSR